MKNIRILFAILGVGSLLAGGLFFWKNRKVNVFEEYQGSVVMLYHKYVFSANINGSILYFNYDEQTGRIPKVTEDLKEAEKISMSNYGTGFFVSEDGKIATNRHVVYNMKESTETNAKWFFQMATKDKISEFDSLKSVSEVQINVWTNKYYQAFWQDDQDRAFNEINSWKALREDYSKELLFWENINNSLYTVKFEVKTLFLGYAQDGAFVDRITDFKECVFRTMSDKVEVDLAIIQTKERKLPVGVKKYIELKDMSTEPLKVGEEVSMLGYNLGPEISLTPSGLKVQQTYGKISQESDGNRILYSINALPGSSGSPVFSKSGRLVAINYYGYESQAFNYGILSKHINKIIEK